MFRFLLHTLIYGSLIRSTFSKSRAELQEDLLIAIDIGNVAEVQRLIDEEKPDLEMAWQENVPLVLASSGGRLEIVKMLLKAGVDVNVQTRDGTRPITTAAYFGRLEVVNALLDAGADVKYIDKAVGISNPLCVAASNNQVEMIKLLLQRGMYIDAPTHSGDTALILASLENRIDAVRELIKQGANLEATNHQGNTPLLAAAYKGNCFIMDELLKHGARYEHTNDDTRFPLIIAAEGGFHKCVRSLLKAGADVNRMDRLNNSAIVFAARSNYFDAVRVLIEYNADLELIDDMKMTALHHAYSHNHFKTVKIMTLAGANHGSTDKHTGISSNNIPKIETCDWFRGLLKQHKLGWIQVTGREGKPPVKACEWIRRLGFEGSIVPLLDQVQLYGYRAMIRLLQFESFGREGEDALAVEEIKYKAYKDIKDMHQKEYRETYRHTEDDVIEDMLPGLLKHKFGVNITLPEEVEEQKRKEEEERKRNEPPPEVLPQIHMAPPEERPEHLKRAPGAEELDKLRKQAVGSTLSSTDADESLAAEL